MDHFDGRTEFKWSPERSVVDDKGPRERNERRHDGDRKYGDLDNPALALVVDVVVELSSLTVPATKRN